MATIEPFGVELRRRRLAAGLSQEALAERAGLSERGVRALERGDRASPRPETLRMLADALGLRGAARDDLFASARPELVSAPARSTPATPAAPSVQHPVRAPLPPLARPPEPSTRLVGRERVVAEACELLRRPAVRLLTLTGPGGIGKTRLSLAVAAELAADFPDRVAFVDLAPLRDPALVSSAIARVLDVREERGRTLIESLRAFLAERALLLVLDNCEQILSGLPVASQLLAASPGSKILATSRERLHLRGERELPIEPLDIPEPAAAGEQAPSKASVEALAGLANVAAVRLFVERAEEAKPGFVLTAQNAPAVVEICRRLEGVPLALELAAARVRHLPPAALLARLASRLPELVDGPRDLPDRQRTLHDAIAWSHDLLTVAEQARFRRLAVFAGGWDLAAAEAATGPASAFGELTSLIDKSLIRQIEAAGQPRYTMLETIREYAHERLAASGEERAIRNEHAVYVLALAQAADKRMSGPEERAWKERLETEHDNLRAALGWLVDEGSPEDALRLGAALRHFWSERGHPSEGRTWLDRALTRADDRPTAARAAALYTAGWVAYHQGAPAEGAEFADASLEVARALDDRPAIASALELAGLLAWRRGDFAGGAALLDDALAIEREFGRATNLAWLLRERATLAHASGDLTTPGPLLEESIALYRQQGYLTGLEGSLANLAVVYQTTGDFGRAEALMMECLQICRDLGSTQSAAMTLGNLANLPQVQADPPRAARYYRESLALFAELGDRASIAEALDDIAGFAATHGRAAEATGLLGGSRALRTAIGLPRPPVFQHLTEQAVAAATAALGEAGFAAAYADGQARSLEETVAETLAWLTVDQAG
jgi:predicted ATPase/transcriptional regulator with XRE-family HTH domain